MIFQIAMRNLWKLKKVFTPFELVGTGSAPWQIRGVSPKLTRGLCSVPAAAVQGVPCN